MSMNIVTSEFIDTYGKFAVWGASKQGKTYWALQCATILANGGKVGVISTERGNDMFLSKRFPHDTIILNVDEDGDPIPRPFSRQRTIEALETFVNAGYKAVVLDSASAVWEGEGGFLDEAKSTNKDNNKKEKDFQVWDTITPLYRAFINQLLDAPVHLVVTVRAKDKYTYEIGKSGKLEPTNKGESPIQRASFFFDLYGHFHIHEFTAKIEGTYCDPLLTAFPDKEIGPDDQARAFGIMRDWLKGKEQEAKSQMEMELLRYKSQNLEWARKTNQWKQRLLYMVLTHYKGQSLPDWKDFTDEDVQMVKSWVDEKLQPKQQPSATLQSTSMPQAVTNSDRPNNDTTDRKAAISVSSLRARLDTVKPTSQGKSVNFEQFYHMATRKLYESDDAISPEECVRISQQLDAVVKARANKQQSA